MLNATPTLPPSGGEPLLYVAELLHRVSNEYASAISLASVMASRASSPEARACSRLSLNIWSSWPRLIGRFCRPLSTEPSTLATTWRGFAKLKRRRNSSGGARPCVLLSYPPWRSTTRAAGASDLSSPSSSRMRRATACRQGAAKFWFRSPPTPRRSYAGSVTTARLQRPSGQASEHVSSMRLRRNSTVMLSDDSVATARR